MLSEHEIKYILHSRKITSSETSWKITSDDRNRRRNCNGYTVTVCRLVLRKTSRDWTRKTAYAKRWSAGKPLLRDSEYGVWLLSENRLSRGDDYAVSAIIAAWMGFIKTSVCVLLRYTHAWRVKPLHMYTRTRELSRRQPASSRSRRRWRRRRQRSFYECLNGSTLSLGCAGR